jgi:iron complex transport system ATP-binding protein
MIVINNFSCGYGKTVVIQDINLEVKPGQFVGLIGPNGSGKTTLIRGISGFLRPRTGAVLLNGEAVGKGKHKSLATKMAVVTQSDEDPVPFSVEEFVLLGRVPHWKSFQLLETPEDHQIAEKAMALAGIRHLRNRPVGSLSGGERQLASLAKALAQEPEVLLLDEPTAHLDIGHQFQIMDLLRKLNTEGLTIVAVLHDLNLASFYCQQLILLHEGCIRREGPPRDVLTEEIINEIYQTSIVVREDPNRFLPLILPGP